MAADGNLKRGPELPYDVVAGVKPCATGWLVASAKLRAATFAPEDPQVIETFLEILDWRPPFATIALDAPVGYLDTALPGGRDCDRQARALLGARRGAAVQSPPTRPQLEGAHASLEGLNAVTRRLMPKYREVAAEMAPFRQRSIYQVNPELSFFQLNEDRPLRYSKRTEAGQEERRQLLSVKVPGSARVFEAELPSVPVSHLIDVAVLMWTARRCYARAATRLPEDAEWDESGLRMELVR